MEIENASPEYSPTYRYEIRLTLIERNQDTGAEREIDNQKSWLWHEGNRSVARQIFRSAIRFIETKVSKS